MRNTRMRNTHDSVIVAKIDRIRGGAPIRTLDLFAGCGGLSLGFQYAGFSIIGAVENDSVAARSHARNFCKHLPPAVLEIHAQPRDITVTSPEDLLRGFGFNEKPEMAVDVIIGGPPCQAFARVGRAKLREVDRHPEAFRLDPRANLYLRYLHYVRRLRPIALLMENVPDALNHAGHNVAEEMCEVLTDLGYVCAYTLLNAAYYGVPQMRERMFLVAYARALDTDVTFPQPTHWVELPKGYESSRQVALKTLFGASRPGQRFQFDNSFYIPPPSATPHLPPAVTAEQALGDLPSITLHLEGKLRRGTRRFTEKVTYSRPAEKGTYAWLMRNWPGFESTGEVLDHVIRYLPRDYAIFRRMNPGDQYPEAYRHGEALFEEKLRALAKEGHPVRPDSPQYRKLWSETVPPYDPGKFPNKWRKMEADRPARTLLAHLGKDSYSHIHYDSAQARTISVREAARLQSFPDGFVFEGTMNPAFRQIGNAVPPVMAAALAEMIHRQITGRSAGVTEACR